MTNRDFINSLSDEEFVEMFFNSLIDKCSFSSAFRICDSCNGKITCSECIRLWLSEEHEDD